MPQGKKNHNHNQNHRARGGSRGANGRGRGEPSHARGLPTPPTTATRRPYPHANTEIDVAIQQWAEPPTDVVPGASGSGTPNKGKSPWNGAQRARPGGTPSRGTPNPRRGASTPRGRGRGRGRPEDAGDPPFARRARFGGGGGGKTPQIGRGATLSDLLNAERPLLRPVKFVRATSTPFLFQRPEDMLKPAVDVADATEASHVPTADRVAQLFRGAETSESDSEHRVEDALEEIDFADLGQIRAAVDAIAATASMNQDVHEDEDMEEVDFADLGAIRAKVDALPPRTSSRDDIIQETFAGVYKQSKDATRVSTVGNVVQQTPPITSSSMDESIHDQDAITLEQESNEQHDVPIIGPFPSPLPSSDPTPRFFVDTTPTRPRGASDVILVDRTGHDYALGNDLDDELIVYVAPHPRSRRSPSPASPPVPRVKLPQTSMLTGRRVARPEIEVEVEMQTGGSRSPVLREDDGEGAALSLASLRIESEPESEPELADVPRARTAKAARRARQKDAVRKRTLSRQLKGRGHEFGAHDAIMSEAMLEDERERRRARWETRRRGDSDLDWGTEDKDDEVDDVDAASDGRMEVDADMDVTAMQGFVESMNAGGSRFVTADDIEDDSSMPDENSDDEDEDEEEEEVFDAEEQRLIVESEGELSEDSSDDDDDDLSPRSSFQARLQKIRQQSRGRRQTAASETSDDDDEDAPEVLPRTRGAKDEDLFAHIQNLLEENSRILPDRGQARGADEWDVERYLDDPEYTTPVNEKRAQRKKKGKGKQPRTEQDSDAELQAMWERDRAKKAAYKQARYEARLLAALDPLAGPGKGKAPRKAMRAAARLDPKTALALAPRAIVDATSLEAQLRRFAGAGPRSVALPPMDKPARKMVHEMAAAFGIQSVSKGQGDGRYATLVRTATTGVGVREARVRAIVRRYGWVGKGGGAEGKREGKGRGAPKHREGDEVGKEAPKIGAGNVGFKMLASMGWSEGDRIGLTGSTGLEAPLTAIIKHSKLGLGATRERE